MTGIPREWEGIVTTPSPIRADRYLAEQLGLMTRSQLKAREVNLFCNGNAVKLSHKVRTGDRLRLAWTEEPVQDILPEPVPLRILYRDADVLVIDKQQGLVTHHAAGNWQGTLANGVLWLALQDDKESTARQVPRCGIVHRLDKDTSGVIIVARTAHAHEYLSRQFRERTARKEYLAITMGCPPANEGVVDTFLARSTRDRKKFSVTAGHGKHAITLYRVMAVWEAKTRKGNLQRYALLALYPRTGRTHQLRVHCQYLGCPILGDPLYGTRDPLFPHATLMLHARRLKISIPATENTMVFKAPLPERFHSIMKTLGTPVARPGRP